MTDKIKFTCKTICNQDQEFIFVKNNVPYTVDIKIQKEFPVRVLMVTLTLLLLPASSARAQAEIVLTFRCRIHRVSASVYVCEKRFFLPELTIKVCLGVLQCRGED